MFKSGDRVYHIHSKTHGTIATPKTIRNPETDQDGDPGFVVWFDDGSTWAVSKDSLKPSDRCCQNPILAVTRLEKFTVYFCNTCKKQTFDEI